MSLIMYTSYLSGNLKHHLYNSDRTCSVLSKIPVDRFRVWIHLGTHEYWTVLFINS